MIKKIPDFIADIEDYIVRLQENDITPKKFFLSDEEYQYLSKFFTYGKSKQTVFSSKSKAMRTMLGGISIVFVSEVYKKLPTLH